MGVEQAVHWEGSIAGPDFVLQPLPVLDPTRDSRACAYAYDGLDRIVGHSTDSSGLAQALLWSRGSPGGPWVPTPLPALLGAEAMAADASFTPGSEPFVVGWSRSESGVETACAWKRDGLGDWTIMPLPHYGPDLAGHATGIVEEDGGVLVVSGWALDGASNMIPQVWRSMDQGSTWSRTPLPLPPLTTAGLGTDPGCGNNRIFVVGSVERAGGDFQAVRWESTDGGQIWSVHDDLAPLPGQTQSQGNAVKVYDERDLWFFAGTSWVMDPAVDGVATLWIDDSGAVTGHAIGDLVVGMPPLTGFHYDGMCRVAGEIALMVGTGADAGTPVVAGPADRHAFVLIEVHDPTGVPGGAVPAASLAAWPNPFGHETVVSFSASGPERTRVTVHDAAGRAIAVLADGVFPNGTHQVTWRGRCGNGAIAPAGVYLVRSVTGAAEVTSRKLVRRR